MDAVAFLHAVGNVGVDIAPNPSEEPAENGGAGDPVNVVVAVNIDQLPRFLSRENRISGRRIVGQ